MTNAQKTALLTAALTDARLTTVQRAAAASALYQIPPVRKDPPPGLLAGPFLTAAGLQAVKDLVPAASPAHFRHAVDDILRRLRGRGRPCSDVAFSVREDGGLDLRWEGDGFSTFSRRSPDREHAATWRAHLVDTALSLGMCLEEETDTAGSFSVVPPEAEVREDATDHPDYHLGHSDETPLDRVLRLARRLFPDEAPPIALAHLPDRPLRSAAEVDLLLWEADRESRAA